MSDALSMRSMEFETDSGQPALYGGRTLHRTACQCCTGGNTALLLLTMCFVKIFKGEYRRV